MSNVMIITRKHIQSLRSAWAALQRPADPWQGNDPRHASRNVHAPLPIIQEYVATVPVTAEMLQRIRQRRVS